MAAPLVINNIDFARKALEIHDRIPVSQFSRLRDLLSAVDGELECRLQGVVGETRKPALRLQVRGEVQLQCQRCLEPLAFGLDIDETYIIVADEAAIPVSAEDEATTEENFIVADTQMRVQDLIEDEVLLALPYAPRHDEAICGGDDVQDELKKPSPFAVLQGLKTGKSQHN